MLSKNLCALFELNPQLIYTNSKSKKTVNFVAETKRKIFQSIAQMWANLDRNMGYFVENNW